MANFVITLKIDASADDMKHALAPFFAHPAPIALMSRDGERIGNVSIQTDASAAPATYADVLAQLAKMGMSAATRDGDDELIRIDDGDGGYILASGDGDGWTLGAYNDDDEQCDSKEIPSLDAFGVASAIYQLINPNAGRR